MPNVQDDANNCALCHKRFIHSFAQPDECSHRFHHDCLKRHLCQGRRVPCYYKCPICMGRIMIIRTKRLAELRKLEYQAIVESMHDPDNAFVFTKPKTEKFEKNRVDIIYLDLWGNEEDSVTLYILDTSVTIKEAVRDWDDYRLLCRQKGITMASRAVIFSTRDTKSAMRNIPSEWEYWAEHFERAYQKNRASRKLISFHCNSINEFKIPLLYRFRQHCGSSLQVAHPAMSLTKFDPDHLQSYYREQVASAIFTSQMFNTLDCKGRTAASLMFPMVHAHKKLDLKLMMFAMNEVIREIRRMKIFKEGPIDCLISTKRCQNCSFGNWKINPAKRSQSQAIDVLARITFRDIKNRDVETALDLKVYRRAMAL